MDGANFRALRERAGFSLLQAVGNVTSQASLSKFETGQSDMGVDKVRGCLDNIGASFLEFASMGGNHDSQYSYYYQVFRAYQSGDLHTLSDLAAQRRRDYEHSRSLVDFHELATTAGLYYELGGTLLLSTEAIDRVAVMLAEAPSWGEVEILEFAAMRGFFAPDVIQSLAESLLRKIGDIERRSELLFRDAWTALLNALETLIPVDAKRAAALTVEYQQQCIPENTLVVTLRLRFLAAIQNRDWDAVDHLLALLDFTVAPELKRLYAQTAERLRTELEGGGDHD